MKGQVVRVIDTEASLYGNGGNIPKMLMQLKNIAVAATTLVRLVLSLRYRFRYGKYGEQRGQWSKKADGCFVYRAVQVSRLERYSNHGFFCLWYGGLGGGFCSNRRRLARRHDETSDTNETIRGVGSRSTHQGGTVFVQQRKREMDPDREVSSVAKQRSSEA